MVLIGVFAALLAVFSQVAIPTPWGMPITLQTFAVALAGYCLGKWKGAAAVWIYLLLGLIGVPVFSDFGAGPAKLFGLTGGYLWSFCIMAFACGCRETVHKKWLSILLGLLGLICCHLCGSIQFAIVSGRTFFEALLLASVPYIFKDILSVIAAYGLSLPILKVLHRTEDTQVKRVT